MARLLLIICLHLLRPDTHLQHHGKNEIKWRSKKPRLGSRGGVRAGQVVLESDRCGGRCGIKDTVPMSEVMTGKVLVGRAVIGVGGGDDSRSGSWCEGTGCENVWQKLLLAVQARQRT